MAIVIKSKKIKFLCHLTFVTHIQGKLYVKDKFCTLLNFKYTLVNVNYVIKQLFTLLTVLNSYYTFLVWQNYIWSTDLKIEAC